MDMMPPQAPPAVTRSTHQEAIDAIQRLVDAQDWMIRQQSQLPHAVEAAGGAEAFATELDAFWSAPVALSPGMTPVARSAAFAETMASVMNDEATIRRLDGTLDERATSLATAFAKSRGHALSPHIQAHDLRFGPIAYAGAVVLVDDRLPDLALLFTPARGWETFDSLARLHADTEARVRQATVHEGELPGIMPDDLAWLDADRFVTSQPIEGNAFDALVSRVRGQLADRTAAAWITTSASPMAGSVSDRVTRAADLHGFLDVEALVRARNERLAATMTAERLATVPSAIRQAWHVAAEGYAAELRAAERARADAGLPDIAPLDAFTHEALATALRAREVTDDPGQVIVEIYPMPHLDTPSAVYEAWVNGIEPPATGMLERITLAELALRNIGFLDRHTFRARRADGGALTRTLRHADIKAMVRGLDIGTAYRDLLLRDLKTSPEGQLTRMLATRVQRARMRFEAADARIGYYAPDESPSFTYDHADRGFEWVSAVLDSPTAAGRRKVETHGITVRQVTYKGVPVKDVLMFGVRSEGSAFRVVYYTPDAPDGRNFREFDDRRQAAREFLHAHAFEGYLLDRLPAGFATVASNGTRHFRVSRGTELATWVLFPGANSSDYVRTDERFDERVVDGDFLEASYDTGVALLSTDLADMARTTSDADADNLSPAIDGETIGRAVSGLIGRPFQSAWHAYDATKAGDFAAAFVGMTDAYVTSLDFLAVGAMKPLLTRSIAVRGLQAAKRLEASGKYLRHPAAVFDARFEATGITTTGARAGVDGVYRIGTATVIEQGGKTYGVRFDAHLKRWRLSRPNAMDANFPGPAISRGPGGSWTFDRGGLLGGVPPLLPPSVGDMTAWQQNTALRHLDTLVGSDDAIRITQEVLYSELHGTPTTRLSVDHVRAWRAALDEGRRAPAFRPGSLLAAGAQAGPVNFSWRPPPSLEALIPEEWPEVLWYYPSVAERVQRGASGALIPMSRQSHTGTVGIEALTMPPQRIESWAASAGITRPATSGSPPWVRINTHELRRRVNVDGDLMFQVFRVRDQTEITYLIRPVRSGDDMFTWLTNSEVIMPAPAPSAAAGSASASAGATPAIAGPSRWSGGVTGLPRMQKPK